MPYKYLILAFNKEVVKRKEHNQFINIIAYEIGMFNGGNIHQEPEEFIEKVFNLIEESGITYKPVDDATLEFGAVRGKDYVSYGKIIKTVVL